MKPPLRWERWQITLKLAILAKEGISIDTLREDPPDKITLPPEPIYEANVGNSTAQSETDCKTRNEQLKNTWLNRCQKIELAGILCGDRLRENYKKKRDRLKKLWKWQGILKWAFKIN